MFSAATLMWQRLGWNSEQRCVTERRSGSTPCWKFMKQKHEAQCWRCSFLQTMDTLNIYVSYVAYQRFNNKVKWWWSVTTLIWRWRLAKQLALLETVAVIFLEKHWDILPLSALWQNHVVWPKTWPFRSVPKPNRTLKMQYVRICVQNVKKIRQNRSFSVENVYVGGAEIAIWS